MSCPTTITPAPIPGINDMRAVTAHGLADAATLLREYATMLDGRSLDDDQAETHTRALAAIQRAAKLLTERDEVLEQLRRERHELAARLAEIERAEDPDADIIEAQRAVVQQLASRPACDWTGKCRHQRPVPHQRVSRADEFAPASAPERADHCEDARRMVCRCGTDGCPDSVACPKGERKA